MHKSFAMLVLLLLVGCFDIAEARRDRDAILEEVGAASADVSLRGSDAKGQKWTIDVSANIAPDELPQTSEMKLLSNDVGAYIRRACESAWRMQSCDVYAQSDKAGALRGYLLISGSEMEGFGYSSDTITAEGRACLLGGSLENIEGNPRAEFTARSSFTTINNGDEAMGMIYLERVADRLRVSDERWNYCYDDRHIDDVYVFIGKMEREIDQTMWGN